MIKEFEAFHGTTIENAEKIDKNGVKIKKYSFLITEQQDLPGDLGAGFYAYKDSFQNAVKFITKFNNIEEINVVKLNLEVHEEKYLDLEEEDNKEIVRQHFNSKQINILSKRFKSTRGAKNRECLDGLIIEFMLHKMKLSVDLISKQTYTPFDGFPKLSNFTNGTELCIRNEKIINNIEIMQPLIKER